MGHFGSFIPLSSICFGIFLRNPPQPLLGPPEAWMMVQGLSSCTKRSNMASWDASPGRDGESRGESGIPKTLFPELFNLEWWGWRFLKKHFKWQNVRHDAWKMELGRQWILQENAGMPLDYDWALISASCNPMGSDVGISCPCGRTQAAVRCPEG